MTHVLNKGGNVGLAAVGLTGPLVVSLTWNAQPGLDADLSAFLVTSTGKVRNDADFIFFNQPSGADGAVQHLGKTVRTDGKTIDQIQIDPSRIPAGIDKVVIGASLDGNGTFAAVNGLGVEAAGDKTSAAAARYDIDKATLSTETALVFAEVYQHSSGWKIRAVGQGYNNGLAGIATDFGVQVDDDGSNNQQSATTPTAPTPAAAPAPAAPISLEKKRMVNLEKKLASNPAMLSLVKTAGVNLEKKGLGEHTARVALVLDISASMTGLYNSGAVKRFCERVLALALRFDDDGTVDVFLFGEKVHKPKQGLTLENMSTYIDNLLRQYPLEYDTRYGAAAGEVRKHYYGKSGDRSEPRTDTTPVYCMFLTDGTNSDPAQMTKQIRSASYEPIFWQFMGIGYEGQFPYLERLDDLDNRYVDNADFFSVSEDDLMGRKPISDDLLFKKMTDEYPGWVSTAKQKRLLA